MTPKLTPGASTGRNTKLPAIPVVRTGNPEMDRFVLAVKEYIEVRDGVRGNPYDRFATMRDVNASVETAKKEITTDGLVLTDSTTSSTTSSGSATSETSKLRTELARTERNLRDTIAQLALKVSENALTSQAVQSLSGVHRYTEADLANDLATGAANVIAGIADGTTVMRLDPNGQFVVFQHKDASVLGTVGAYTGTVRTALGITSGGILGGFNRKSDGVWQTSFAIESATGNLTVLGTIKANSIVEVGAFIGSTGGLTVGDLSDLATYAAGEVDNKLNSTGSDILSGDITFSNAGGFKTGSISIDSSGNVSGAGVAFTSKGIVGRTVAATTFTLNATTGSALFKGDIQTAGDAVFEGNNTAVISVFIGGVDRSLDYSTLAIADSSSPNRVRAGHFGYARSNDSQFNIGLVGVGDTVVTDIGGGATRSVGGIGVVGEGGGFGGYFSSSSLEGIGLEVINTGGGTALSVIGPMKITSTALVTNLNAERLNGLTADKYPRIFPTNSGTANAAGSGLSLLGSGSTGIAGAYVGTSGSGNTVTFEVQASSPSDVRLKEEIEDTDLGLEFVNQLRPVSYKLKNDPKHQKGYGFIADEVEELVGLDSSLVYFEPDWKMGDIKGFKTVHYPSYIAILTKAVQELSAKVDAMQEEITALKATR